MQLEPRIENKPQITLVGHRKQMSMANDTTRKLWQGFMPHRKQIKNTAGEELYSVSIFPKNYFSNFDPETKFEKWAAVAVNKYEPIKNMESILVPEGLYAIFEYKGLPSEARSTFDYIFREWIPRSEYNLDNRPHLSVMGEKYKNDDPSSEEEFWIPVVSK